MGLKYLKNDKISELETNIEINIKNYAGGIGMIESSDYLDSNLSMKDFKLLLKDGRDSKDLENAKLVYESLKTLTPLEASDERIWIGLTHTVEGMKYSINRWGITAESSKGTIKDRFFGNPMRNSISRLWWYGYISYNDGFDNPYELTELLTKNQDIAVGIMERNFSRNRKFVQNFLKALYEWTVVEKNEFPKTNDFRKVTKGINRISAVTLIDLIEVKDLKKIIKKYC